MFRCCISFLTLISLGLAVACAPRISQSFRVVPSDPAYLLRSPDKKDTPFGEVLRAYNGFEPGRNWIDLQPLTGLRIENAYYEKGANRKGLTGFLGTEVARYDLTSAGLHLFSTEPMKNRPEWDVAAQDLISTAQLNLSSHRFFYEIVFSKKDNKHGAVLLSAASLEEIERLSAQLADPETVCTEGSIHCTVFPEACSVSVEMKVVLNGKPEVVFWGSQLLSALPQTVHHLEMKRLYQGRLTPVKLDVGDSDALRLPLLPGDEVSWR
jgi:hypothetical protein